MDTVASSKLLFLFMICSFGLNLASAKDSNDKNLKHEPEFSSRRQLAIRTIRHDLITGTTFPTNPVTNPVTTPSTMPDNSIPGIITIPPANPGGTPLTIPPTNPIPNPVDNPVPQVPITNPGNIIPGGQQPVTNPVTTYNPTNPTGGGGIPSTNPMVAPPVTTTSSAPAVPGQSWCVARSGVTESAIQAALDYACGIGGADCAAIQDGASCYNPNSLQNHASYAFNSYYQRNPVPTSCDFGGTAVVTYVNPSSGSCIYPTSSPMTTNPASTPGIASSTGATPATGSGTPPSVLNAGNPGMGGGTTSTTGGFGESPATAYAPTVSISSGLQPFFGWVIVVASVTTGRIVLEV